MMSLDEIKAPISKQMDEFEIKFKASIKSSAPLLDKITAYILKKKGKQIRPIFVFLSAALYGNIKESSYRAASLIELLHTATLVHDDVVDDSNERRGVFSVNALWKNKISVLVGDYLLSKGLLISLDNNDFDLLRIVSEAVREMSEGELLQIKKARNLNIKEDIYFEIIRKKTASLFASCCACGAASAGADVENIKRMHDFGEMVGIAFQIKDDLFDYLNNNNAGKPFGIDIKEQKMTLPLIHLLNNQSYFEKRKIINIVKNHNTDIRKVAQVIEAVNKSGGIEYATNKMQEYQAKAFELIKEFPDSIYKKALEELVAYAIERKK
ncbi:MAG: polyprenyl synthetase [Bacteroidetes bacterium CG2_30_32_10]|nr:MAG: polyprenyl synthetase [Bacteroidetes bacterium CG2_30_32_10]